MQTVIVVIHLMVVLTLTGLVLLQKSEGGGLGMGNSGGGFLSSRGTANVLTRSTAILAAIFFATSLILSVLAGLDRRPRSILNTGAPNGAAAPAIPLGSSRNSAVPGAAAPGADAPGAPAVPAPEPTVPVPVAPAPVPAAPAAPQVPLSR